MENSITTFFLAALSAILVAVFIGYLVDVLTINQNFEQNVQNAEIVRLQAQIRADEEKFNNVEVLYTDVISLILRNKNSDLTIRVLPADTTHGGTWSPTVQQTQYDMLLISNRLVQTSTYMVKISRGMNDELVGYDITRQ